MYEERIYRNWTQAKDLVGIKVMVKETDLFVAGERDLSREAVNLVAKFRGQIEGFVAKYPEFEKTLEPFKVNKSAPRIVRDMARASSLAGVGPFACVAGVIAEYVGKDLLKYSQEIIVENGGDIFIKSKTNRIVGIYAGSSFFTKRIALNIKARETPMGICTSSGTVGHSLSFGKADAVIALSESTLLADAAATSIANRIKKKEDISQGIKIAQKMKKLRGLVIIKDEKLGIWGKVEICKGTLKRG